MRTILALLVVLLLSPARAEQTLHLIMVAGQSNAAGAGDISQWPAQQPRHASNIWTFRKDNARGTLKANQWQHPATPNVQGYRVGPALSMADNLARLRPGSNIGLVPCALGGSTVTQWQYSSDPDSLYQGCITQVARAIEACRAMGFVCELDAIAWWQAESDTWGDIADPEHWVDKTHAIFAAFRVDFGNAQLPIIYVRLGPKNELTLPYWDNLRASQPKLRKTFADGMVRMLSIDDVPRLNKVHYTTPSQIIIGHRLAAVLNQMLD